MVFCIEEENEQMEMLNAEVDHQALINAIKTLSRVFINIEMRLSVIEGRSDRGMASYMILHDLLRNIRSNGGLSSQVADSTLDEIIDYLHTRGGNHAERLRELVEALRDPDGSWI